jgi:hypothetical protein
MPDLSLHEGSCWSETESNRVDENDGNFVKADDNDGNPIIEVGDESDWFSVWPDDVKAALYHAGLLPEVDELAKARVKIADLEQRLATGGHNA